MGKRLYVGNLPYDADEASLREAFSQDGRSVERVHIVLDRETQRPRGFAFVEFSTDEQAKQAMAAMDGTMFGTRQLRVTEAEERRPAGPGGPPRGPGAGPRYDRGPTPGGSGPRPGGSYGGSSGGGGAPRPMTDEEARLNRFGPDARPKHERGPERKTPPKRRGEGESDDAYGGRRGSRRFDDDEE